MDTYEELVMVFAGVALYGLCLIAAIVGTGVAVAAMGGYLGVF